MSQTARRIALATTLVLLTGLVSSVAHARSFRRDTAAGALVRTDGAQALVAAAQYVDDEGSLDFSLLGLLSDPRADFVLLAPSNRAFEALLGQPEGSFDGASIDALRDALPDLVDVTTVQETLLRHVILVRKASVFRFSELDLVEEQSFTAADTFTPLTFGIGGSGVTVNFESTIIRANVQTRNAVIHFIDTVIGPAS